MSDRAKITIGTAEDCDWRIEDEYASAHHALVTLHEDWRLSVTDLGSTNGTWIKGDFSDFKALLRTPLSRAGELKVGHTRIAVQTLLKETALGGQPQPAAEDGPKLPYRMEDLDGYSTEQGPTYNGGWFSGSGRHKPRHLLVWAVTPSQRPASVEVGIGDGDEHGCAVTMTAEQARTAAAALLVAASKVEASAREWQAIRDGLRRDMADLALRAAEARTEAAP